MFPVDQGPEMAGIFIDGIHPFRPRKVSAASIVFSATLGRKEMNRLIVIGIALLTATSAYAMSPVMRHETNGTVIQVREGCGAGRVRVNGICVARTTIRHVRRENRRCRRWNAGACVHYY